jgi:glycosyltransferase involved in cell wall biosynthesis
MEYRPYYLAKEWVRQGHKVTIVAASFSHVRTKPPLVNDRITHEEIDGIHYLWLKTPGYYGNGVRRALNIFSFVGQLITNQTILLGHILPDVIIASSTYPLDMVPAYRMAKKVQARLVFEVHDLWPLSLIELADMSPRHPFIMLLQWAEDFAYRRADRVVSILPKAKNYMQKHGMTAEKFVHIPNGIDITEWRGEQPQLPKEHSQVIDELKQSGRFIIGYAGAHGLANSLDTLINAASGLQDQPVAFVLVGQGSEKEKLQEVVQQRGILNVVFLPTIQKSSIPSLLASMDALYIGLKKEPLFRFGVSPNKLLDYMMAAKPVIYAIDAGNDLVVESGCGISVESENPEAVSQAVMELLRMPAADLEAMGQRGWDYVMAYHDYKVLAQEFLDILQ